MLVAEPAGTADPTASLCRELGRKVQRVPDGAAALEALGRGAATLVLVDAELDDGAGLELLDRFARGTGAPPVLFLAPRGDVPRAVEAMRRGAFDVLQKPLSREALGRALERISMDAGTPDRPGTPTSEELAVLSSSPWIGRSRQLERTLRHVERAAATPRTTVLITGESGVGKELVARAVHERSARGQAPFVAVNCAALAENLLEAELFGYEAGAFTGGNPTGRRGLVAAAEGGTLFLDEVGELAPELQAKLLRVLQERSYRRVGGDVDLPTDVRFVASTNRDLVAMVDEGTFREDLFYRLNVLSIVVPPLRERPEDVEPLALHFLERFGNELQRRFTGFSEAAMEGLRRHAWPGNVRELRNAVERASALAPGGEVRPEHLGLPLPRAEGDGGARRGDLPLVGWNLRDMEQALIRRVLTECSGNRSRAARELGINRATLYNKLRQYGLGA